MSADITHRSIPWRSWFELAFGAMKLAPQDFWRMSLVEWSAAIDGHARSLGADGSVVPLSQAELQELIEQFPDDLNVVEQAS